MVHRGTKTHDRLRQEPDHQPREADENAKQYGEHAIAKKAIREYTDWDSAKPFNIKPIEIQYGTHMIARIRNYVHTDEGERKSIRQKHGLEGTVNNSQERWQTRRVEKEGGKLQQAAAMNNMHPIWATQGKLQMEKSTNNISAKKKDVSECQRVKDALLR